jgi:hypothetical protein
MHPPTVQETDYLLCTTTTAPVRFKHRDAPELQVPRGATARIMARSRLVHMHIHTFQAARQCDLNRPTPLASAAHPARVSRWRHPAIPAHPLSDGCSAQQRARVILDEGSNLLPQRRRVARWVQAVAERVEQAGAVTCKMRQRQGSWSARWRARHGRPCGRGEAPGGTAGCSAPGCRTTFPETIACPALLSASSRESVLRLPSLPYASHASRCVSRFPLK